MKVKNALVALMIGAGLLATSPVMAGTQDAIVAKTLDGISYVNGGIGKDEEDAMRHMAGQYPLRLIFSEHKDGEFLADVPVTIYDVHGKRVLELAKAGPMLYVKLPDGRYKVRARFKGRTESREVTLAGTTGKDLYFNWKGRPKS